MPHPFKTDILTNSLPSEWYRYDFGIISESLLPEKKEFTPTPFYEFSRAILTPLGRVFKIQNIFLHDFIGFLTSINYMDKWVTPLGVR